MTSTRIADNVAWHIHKEAKKERQAKQPKPPVQPKSPKQPKPPKPLGRIDAKFAEWAARNKVDLRDIPVMKEKK